ncbi:MAG: UDP-N-acetylmuramoyl-tripeptide--D-alanyl-D-alanine ligase, partial [Candidatus Omnitrophica bacterium]|nr:UDP-N-acetylmuramoyl-tripeptide--D-alanyl-D-alanine ligase [Candidatus Omnitrophota bacterium]
TSGKLVRGVAGKKNLRISIDSRSIKPGEVFVAVRGKNFDGHKFIYDVISKGAAGIVSSKKIMWIPSNFRGKTPPEIPVIKVKDTNKALGDIAGFYRRKFDIPVVAITGSVGKTSTKEIASNVLMKKYPVLKNTKTENNMFGVSLTLLNLNKLHKAAVIEFGTNHFGEIAVLSKIARPTIAIFTNIGESHLQHLQTPAGVFREKFQLVKYMDKNGVIIFNADDEHLSSLLKKNLSQKTITFGIEKKADFQAVKIEKKGGKITFAVSGKKYCLNTFVEHNIYNALAAICCGSLNNIGYNSILTGIKTPTDCQGRQKIRKFGKITVIDDTYNSNPLSFKSAIRTLGGLKAKGKKIIVCSDMLELGSTAKQLHENMSKDIEAAGIDLVVTFGSLAKHITNALKNSRITKATHYNSIEAVKRRVKVLCNDGDIVLVKGSRSTNMERIVEFLEKNED